MRASEVRMVIVNGMLALNTTLDERAGVNDKYVYLKTPKDPGVARDRSFRVSMQMQPVLDPTLNTCDGMIATWTLATFHPWSPTVDDRIAEDSERIDRALAEDALIALNEDIIHVTVSPLGLFETAALVSPRWAVTVQYRCHEVLT